MSKSTTVQRTYQADTATPARRRNMDRRMQEMRGDGFNFDALSFPSLCRSSVFPQRHR